MAWETRGNRQYYYQTERVGGRVVKSYVGSGQVAELTNLVNEDKKAVRDAGRARVRAATEDLTRLEGIIAPLDDFARIVAEAVMLAAGYHRIKRGPWRKCRGQADERAQDDTDSAGSGRDSGTAR